MHLHHVFLATILFSFLLKHLAPVIRAPPDSVYHDKANLLFVIVVGVVGENVMENLVLVIVVVVKFFISKTCLWEFYDLLHVLKH